MAIAQNQEQHHGIPKEHFSGSRRLHAVLRSAITEPEAVGAVPRMSRRQPQEEMQTEFGLKLHRTDSPQSGIAQ